MLYNIHSAYESAFIELEDPLGISDLGDTEIMNGSGLFSKAKKTFKKVAKNPVVKGTYKSFVAPRLRAMADGVIGEEGRKIVERVGSDTIRGKNVIDSAKRHSADVVSEKVNEVAGNYGVDLKAMTSGISGAKNMANQARQAPGINPSSVQRLAGNALGQAVRDISSGELATELSSIATRAKAGQISEDEMRQMMAQLMNTTQ